MKVRTRVAPSPTGDPHVGTAYMALFSYCHARKHGGEFILRIEDTDAERSSKQSEDIILDSLRWLGLDWDEGPDKGGPYGPYRQSERSEIYAEHVDRLLSDGHAFHCFCSRERLDEVRSAQMSAGETTRYDGHCLSLTDDEVAARLASGEASVVRMKVPDGGECVVQDALRGEIRIAWSQVDMQVLMKADGLPTYHLAVVVDDHLMQITDIIRGEEWINSAPKHMLLYDYLGWQMPRLFHMPLLRNPDKSKLSKRKNPTSIGFYKAMGFLPEATLNYLGMLGWSMPNGEEKFSIAEMISHFDISRISLGAPIFDVDKLRWLNGRWLRETLTEEAFADCLIEWAYNRENLRKIIPLVKDRVDVFSELAPMISFFAEGMPDISEKSFEFKKLEPNDVKKYLQFVLWRLESQNDWHRDVLEEVFSELAKSLGIKIRELLGPVFIAFSGKSAAPPLFDSMAIVGPDLTRARIRHALNILGGVSKKQAKSFEKEYRQL